MQNLIVNYEKILKPKLSRCGYSDVKGVAKRYQEWFKQRKLFSSRITTAENDNIYFFSKECKPHIDTLNEPISLLDVGCGAGSYSEIFSNRYVVNKKIIYQGCEVDRSIVMVCEKNYPNYNFFISFADDIKVKSNCYDIVFCSSTIQYTLEKWKESILEMKRVARKYLFLVRFPVTKFHKTFFVNQKVIDGNRVENHNFVVLNRDELESYLEKVGLDILKRDYSSEEYLIKGVKEKIVLNQYLLEKSIE